MRGKVLAEERPDSREKKERNVFISSSLFGVFQFPKQKERKEGKGRGKRSVKEYR